MFRQAVHAKLFPVFEQFAHPDTQHTLILILLHALTLTVRARMPRVVRNVGSSPLLCAVVLLCCVVHQGYCVELIRFCYWVKEFSALTVDKVVEQATELSAERTCEKRWAVHIPGRPLLTYHRW
jgi:hypothetical protein